MRSLAASCTARSRVTGWSISGRRTAGFEAAEIAARDKKVGTITIEVARRDLPVADRRTSADTDPRAAAKGLYVIREFAPGPRHGYVVAQGAFATFNLLKELPRLQQAGVNVKAISAVSEDRRLDRRGHRADERRSVSADARNRGAAHA